MSKKHQVIEDLYNYCKTNPKLNFIFDNNLVKEFCVKNEFGNPFDVTKIDSKDKLPKLLIDNDIAIIHLGSGKHKFIKGINKVYHHFEKIQDEINWDYKKSILNNYNTSESNVLSVANNQRILHHFLFGVDKEFDNVDITKRPKTYFPHRTKTSLSYNFGENTPVLLKNVQIEIDLTIEYECIVGVFEAKNGEPETFNIYQIYHPFLYYQNKAKSDKLIKNIFSVYVVRQKYKDGDVLKLWKYTFDKIDDITSIKLIKSASYKLINQKS